MTYKINFRFLLSTSSGISGLITNFPNDWWSSDINYYHIREDENCLYVEGEAYLEVLAGMDVQSGQGRKI
jgi:hypothetical protein